MKKILGVWIIALIMTSFSAYAFDLSEFPGLFIGEDSLKAVVVVGKSAKAEDVIGAVDIVSSLQYELNKKMGEYQRVDVARFDTEVLQQDPKLSLNSYIIVGGPCINAVAARLMNYPANCMEGFDVGKAVIRMYGLDNNNTAMLVAGATAMDTKRATFVVSNYNQYALEGEEMIVSKVNLKDVSVNPIS